jgi:exopolyphosphatase/guanosine-5'-triphosphate,3'-diphosphate pyrophosphatase
MDVRYRPILYLAALLHEIGLFIDSQSYHKHTMYLISNSDFFGIGLKDVQLIALVARYHRRATPQPDHEGYSLLDRNDRVAVTKLASILRIARALDSSRNQLVQKVQCQRVAKRINILVDSPADLSLEQIELRKDATMFSDTFGCSVRLTVPDVSAD